MCVCVCVCSVLIQKADQCFFLLLFFGVVGCVCVWGGGSFLMQEADQSFVLCAFCPPQVVDGTVFQFSVLMQEADQCLSSECMTTEPPNSCPPSQKAKVVQLVKIQTGVSLQTFN